MIMCESTNVLLVTGQKATAKAVSEALKGQERFTLAESCADLDKLQEQMARLHASGVLVDIDPEPGLLLKQVESLAARFPETKFVLLSHKFGPDLMLEGMQAGARGMLLKSAIKADLASTLGRLLPDSGHGSSGNGKIITLLSGGGGCGVTTLAFNLANELALASTRESLLVDLDWYYGALAPYLGLQGKFGIGDLLARDSRIDGNLVRSTAVAYSDHLHVLLSPASINAQNTEFVPDQNLNQVLSACRQAYAHTIIDAPRVSRQVAVTLAEASTSVMMVFQLTVKDIHKIRSLRTTLLESGIPESRIVLVANRYDKRSSVSLEDAQIALGGLPVSLIANDYRAAVHNVNFGRPLSESAPTSLLRRDLNIFWRRLQQGVFASQIS